MSTIDTTLDNLRKISNWLAETSASMSGYGFNPTKAHKNIIEQNKNPIVQNKPNQEKITSIQKPNNETINNQQTEKLLKEFNINPNQKLENPSLPKNINDLSPNIPQHLLKGITGKAAAYAFAKGDFFGGITILSEGVRANAFYYDPASGGKRGILINTHPGITLQNQTENEITNMFNKTTISKLTSEIITHTKGANKTITPNMAKARLTFNDYYYMFKTIENKYSQGTYNALKINIKNNQFGKEMLKKGLNEDQIMGVVLQNLPKASYAVLEHATYKYGNAGIKKFKNLLNCTLNAGLDVKNQEKHLTEGATHIVYHYSNGKSKNIVDTRVMNIHRLFYLGGNKFSPELRMKISTSSENLNKTEETLVNNVSEKAGIGKISENGKIKSFPDSEPKSSIQLNVEADISNKGVKNTLEHKSPTVKFNKPKENTSKHDPNNKAPCSFYACQNVTF